MRKSDLSYAVLSGSNLEKADLRGAEMKGIDFRSLRLKNTRIDPVQAIQVAESFGCTCR